MFPRKRKRSPGGQLIKAVPVSSRTNGDTIKPVPDTHTAQLVDNNQSYTEHFSIELELSCADKGECSSRWPRKSGLDQMQCVSLEKDMRKAITYFRGFHKVIKENTTTDDPIFECGEELVRSIECNPKAAVCYADAKLHVFPFSDVAECWKRLHTDASIVAACKSIADLYENFLSKQPVTGKCRYDWVDEVLHILDMAFLLSGTPRRGQMVDVIIDKFRSDCKEYQTFEGGRWGYGVDVPNYFFPAEDSDGGWEDSDSGKDECIFYPRVKIPVGRCTVDVFEQSGVDKSTPYVLLDIVKDWKAFSGCWPWRKPPILMHLTFEGRRLVPVEIGRNYTDEGFSQKIMPFKEFMEHYLLNPRPDRIGYVAQHDIFSHIPDFESMIKTPRICLTQMPASRFKLPPSILQKPRLAEPLRKIWIGPAGTVSPLHHDPYHNILCQVVGKKYIRLYSPDECSKLYPKSMELGVDMSNTSEVPAERFEMRRIEIDDEDGFPLFNEAQYVETILEQGDALYIPVGWWHYVKSLTVSISVSFWWN